MRATRRSEFKRVDYTGSSIDLGLIRSLADCSTLEGIRDLLQQGARCIGYDVGIMSVVSANPPTPAARGTPRVLEATRPGLTAFPSEDGVEISLGAPVPQGSGWLSVAELIKRRHAPIFWSGDRRAANHGPLPASGPVAARLAAAHFDASSSADPVLKPLLTRGSIDGATNLVRSNCVDDGVAVGFHFGRGRHVLIGFAGRVAVDQGSLAQRVIESKFLFLANQYLWVAQRMFFSPAADATHSDGHPHEPHHRRLLSAAPASKGSAPLLNPREIEILHWMSEGKTAWEIARILEISSSYVEKKASEIFRKLDCSNRNHAVFKGFQLGLLK